MLQHGVHLCIEREPDCARFARANSPCACQKTMHSFNERKRFALQLDNDFRRCLCRIEHLFHRRNSVQLSGRGIAQLRQVIVVCLINSSIIALAERTQPRKCHIVMYNNNVVLGHPNIEFNSNSFTSLCCEKRIERIFDNRITVVVFTRSTMTVDCDC